MSYKCDGINCQARHDLVVELGGRVPTHTSPQCWYVAPHDKNYAAEVALLQYDFNDDLEEIAKRAWQDVVVPFCDEHGLQFTAGMGVYIFERLDEPPYPHNITSGDWDTYIDDDYVSLVHNGYDDYADKKPPEGYEAVRALLTIRLFHGQLYEFMTDYPPEKNKEDEDGPTNQS